MRIVVEIQILGIARTFREHAHRRTSFQHEARAFGPAIQVGKQSLLKAIADLGERRHDRVLY